MLSLKYSKSFLASNTANVFCDTAFVSTNSTDLKHSGTKTRQRKSSLCFIEDFAWSLGGPAPAPAFLSDRAILT